MSYSKVRAVAATLDTNGGAIIATQIQGEKGFQLCNPALTVEEGGTGQKIYYKIHAANGTPPTLAQMQAGNLSGVLYPGQLLSTECQGLAITAAVDSDTLDVTVEVFQ
jgi:hypothetical protein